jgi:tetratricopeptide (TPR) repeat protein
MLETFLDRPEDELDPLDPDYSGFISSVLQRIYARPKARRFSGIHLRLEPQLQQSMGMRQRVRVLNALGRSYHDAHRASDAAANYDEALEDVAHLADTAAYAVIAMRQSHLHYVNYSILSALDYALEARDAFMSFLQMHLTGAQNVREFGLSLLWELATQSYLMQNYTESRDYLDEARSLAHTLNTRSPREASIAWTAAIVEQSNGHPLAALAHAHEALALYEQYHFGSEAERARMAVVFAEIAMDAAQHMSDDQDNFAPTIASHLVEEADRYLQGALKDLLRVDDKLGYARAQVIWCRYTRLAGRQIERWDLYQGVEDLGQRLEDKPLLCQVWTERGNEFLARDNDSAAYDCYRRALDALGTSDASVVGAPACQALILASSYRADT